MTENRVVALRQKGAIDDPLTEILRTGARRLIAQAVEAEFETFLASTAELVLPDGRRRVVRHGHDPVVCPAKAGMFSRRKACRGKSQKPRSLDSRVAGNQDSEAYRQRLPRGDDEPPGRNESKRECGLENA